MGLRVYGRDPCRIFGDGDYWLYAAAQMSQLFWLLKQAMQSNGQCRGVTRRKEQPIHPGPYSFRQYANVRGDYGHTSGKRFLHDQHGRFIPQAGDYHHIQFSQS